MIFETTPLGEQHSSSDFIFFFGNKNSSMDALKKQFPALSFVPLKQTHGDHLVDSSNSQIKDVEADAHFSSSLNQGLISITADCVPILICSPDKKFVCAVHAGWRGVAHQILPKAITRLHQLGCSLKNLKIAIGPHIQFESFEVGKNVQEQILSSLVSPEPQHFMSLNANKSKVNLAAVLISQLLQVEPDLKPVYVSKADTFRSPDLHSFRRDSKSAGRQYSFAALLSK